MRIIAGAFKGRRLRAPRWSGLRPTSDKLRETLFNVIAVRVAGARVLDGFAGTGALGLEALSRGAAAVTFVERDRRAASLIDENIRRCGVRDGYAIIRGDFRWAVARLIGQSFDLVLLDPPYEDVAVEDTLAAAGAVLADDGLLVYEHATRRSAPSAAGPLERVRELVAGDSALSFYRRGR